MDNFDLRKYLAEGKLYENEEQGYTLYTTNVEYDNGKTGYMYQLVNSEDREENEIGFDQLYFDDEDNRLEMGRDFKDFDQGSFQEEEVSAEEAMKMYKSLAEGKLLNEAEYTEFIDDGENQYIDLDYNKIRAYISDKKGPDFADDFIDGYNDDFYENVVRFFDKIENPTDEEVLNFVDIEIEKEREKYIPAPNAPGGRGLAENKLLKEEIDFPEMEDEFEGAMDAMMVEPEVYLQDIIDASAEEIVSDDYYEIMNAVEQGIYSKDEVVKLAKTWAKSKLSGLAEGESKMHTQDKMNNFDLKKYLAEGKLLKEEKYSGAIIRKGESDKAKEDTKIVRQALKKAGIKFTNRGEFGMNFKDADLAQIKKVIAGEKVGEFVVSRDITENKLLKEDNLRDYWSEWAAGEVEVGNDGVIDAGGVDADFENVPNETMNTFKDYVKAVKALNADSKELRDDIAGAVSSITFNSGDFEDYEFDVLTAKQFDKIKDII
jgi:hypothetical protein